MRTDLQKMRNLHAFSTYRVTHPYGVFTFDTDGNGNTTGGGGVAVRLEDPAGTAALWMPQMMKDGFTTGIGPFLRPASYPGTPLPTRQVGGVTHTYIGDPAVGVVVTGGTNGNIFKIERIFDNINTATPTPVAPIGINTIPAAPASTWTYWQTDSWLLAGRVFTGPIALDLTVSATYARDAASAQVDIFATTLPGANLTVSGIPGATSLTAASPITGKYFLHTPLAGTNIPTGVVLTNSLDLNGATHPLTLVDEVVISEASFNPLTNLLTIKAASRDTFSPPTLTAADFATANTFNPAGIFTRTLTDIPPQTVRVTSSKLGSAAAPVSVLSLAVPTLTITVPAGSTNGAYSVSWSASTTPGATYVLQEATSADFLQNLVETVGAISPKAYTGKANGTYYYRVKAQAPGFLDSAWAVGANGCAVTTPPPVAVVQISPSGDIGNTSSRPTLGQMLVPVPTLRHLDYNW